MRRRGAQRVRSVAGWALFTLLFLGGLAWSAIRQDERGPAAQAAATALFAAVALLIVVEASVVRAYNRTVAELFWEGYHDAPWHPLWLIALTLVGLAAGLLLAVAWLALLFI